MKVELVDAITVPDILIEIFKSKDAVFNMNQICDVIKKTTGAICSTSDVNFHCTKMNQPFVTAPDPKTGRWVKYFGSKESIRLWDKKKDRARKRIQQIISQKI